MQYQVPTWYKNKRINLEAIADAQLAAIANDMLATDQHNQSLYAEAIKQRGQMVRRGRMPSDGQRIAPTTVPTANASGSKRSSPRLPAR